MPKVGGKKIKYKTKKKAATKTYAKKKRKY